MTRIINCILVTAIIVGAIMYVRQNNDNRLMQVEIDRLVAEVGFLEPDNVQTPRLITIKSDDSMFFRWRIYLPANSPRLMQSEIIHGQGGGTSKGGGGNRPSEVLITAKFELSNGELGCYLKRRNWSRMLTDGRPNYSGGGGAGRDRVARGKAASFLKDHWEELQISVFESDGRTAIDLAKPIQLLEINIPEDLYSKMTEAAVDDAAGFSRFEDLKKEPFYRLTIGTTR